MDPMQALDELVARWRKNPDPDATRKALQEITADAEDGRLEHRDLELVTEHYSRSQMAGKRQAGFHLYRAGGEGRRTGGTP